MRWVWYRKRGNDYGVAVEMMWPHVSLGLSAHMGRFGHLTIHTPIGLAVVGCIGVSAEREQTL